MKVEWSQPLKNFKCCSCGSTVVISEVQPNQGSQYAELRYNCSNPFCGYHYDSVLSIGAVQGVPS